MLEGASLDRISTCVGTMLLMASAIADGARKTVDAAKQAIPVAGFQTVSNDNAPGNRLSLLF